MWSALNLLTRPEVNGSVAPRRHPGRRSENDVLLGGADPQFLTVALSSPWVLSYPETVGRLRPGCYKLTGRSSRYDRLHREARVRLAVRERQEVPSAHPDRPDRSQVRPAHL